MKNIVTLIIVLFTCLLSAQNIKVRGVINDSIGNPLELANVIATVKSSGAIESYGK